MIIRQETQQDYPAVYQLVQEAFEGAEHSDGTEQDLVVALRKSEAFIPELSLVAEADGKLVGHILFSKNKIGAHDALTLAPLAVLPAYQGSGVGTALMDEGHRIARALGFSCSIVLGSERYYPRVGYVPAERFGIQAPFPVPSENFMALPLSPEGEQLCGIVTYAKEFGL